MNTKEEAPANEKEWTRVLDMSGMSEADLIEQLKSVRKFEPVDVGLVKRCVIEIDENDAVEETALYSYAYVSREEAKVAVITPLMSIEELSCYLNGRESTFQTIVGGVKGLAEHLEECQSCSGMADELIERLESTKETAPDAEKEVLN